LATKKEQNTVVNVVKTGQKGYKIILQNNSFKLCGVAKLLFLDILSAMTFQPLSDI